MNASNYIRIFDSFLDNRILNCGILLIGPNSTNEKLYILNEIAFRLQIEFGKRVCLVSNEELNSDIETFTSKDDPFSFISKNDCVFLCNLQKSYFNDGMWYNDLVNQLKYYKRTFFGFTTGSQQLIFYEEDLENEQ